MSALGDTLAALSEAFSSVGVRWYLFGAQAVSVRGVPRATQDVDVTLSGLADVGALVAALTRAGFRHRFPDIADELMRDGAVMPLVHVSAMDVDVVFGGTEIEDLAAARATIERVAGVEVPVASPVDLVIAKLIAGRAKDLEDVDGILARTPVDLDEVEEVLTALDRAVGTEEYRGRVAALRSRLPAGPRQMPGPRGP